jgi:hypothetical protein
MLLEELLERFVETRQAKAQVEASLQDLQARILQIYEEGKLKEKIVGDRRFLKIEVPVWKTSLEEARKLNATEMVEQLNKTRLKRLHEQGVEIPGRTISAHIRVYGPKDREL